MLHSVAMTRLLCPLLAIMLCGAGQWAVRGGQAEHVVLVVWDGMRPDFVTPQYTPVLHELASRGTFFRNHRCTYVTSTEVNGASLATGLHPDGNGIAANVQHNPALSWLGTYATESLDAVRRGDLLTDGHYLEAATVPEILQQAGFRTITAGAKPVVFLHDRAFRKVSQAQKDSVTLFRGQSLPRAVVASLEKLPEVGPFPVEKAPESDSTRAQILKYLRLGKEKAVTLLYGEPKTPPVSRQVDDWTAKALVHGLWKDGVPKFTLLWLSEPDASQHRSGVGSEDAQAGLAASDRNLRLVLQALSERGVLSRTDVLVVSDHGFSTVDRGPDVISSLRRAGFIAGKQFENPEPGDIMVVYLGGSTFFYVFDHDEQTIRRLVYFLQCSDFAGVIFAAVEIEGTFPLSQARLDARRGAPDVVISTRWNAERNNWDARGMLTAPGGTRGRGAHGSLSRYDLHNTLIAAGPDFKQGFVSDLPSGNVDVPPTILAILGVPAPAPMDGRVLTEAMMGFETAAAEAETQVLEASRDLGFRTWRQTLRLIQVGSTVYFEEGNGESRLK